MENGSEQKAIEEAFLKSWDQIEEFFSYIISSERASYLTPIHTLIAELRKRGYDRQFRAGQVVHMLVLSRSREHGLRSGQPSLSFELKVEGGMRIYYEEGRRESKFEVEQVAITPEIEALLERLLAQPID